MDKRKKLISILAGLMALIMLLGLIAGFIPAAHAAIPVVLPNLT